ncbi:MAG: Ldh family oxidoreductase [Caldilineaceae bacterium]
MLTFTASFLTTQIAKILVALNTPDDLAELMANSLVGANLAGHDSHGVILLSSYAAQIRAGTLKPTARASLESPTAMLATLAVDGAMGWGPPAAYLACDKTIERAQQFGIGAAVIRQCQHIGRVGQYAERIAAQKLIGIVTCNSGSGVAPFGSKQRMLGTNPIAIGVPRQGDQAPVLFDGSTSVVAGNKLSVLVDKGLPAPAGWIIDQTGQPSTHPADFFAGGALLPLGGYKGYALGVMVEMLAGLLSGASAAFLPDFAVGNGVLVIAIRPDAFIPLDHYLAQVERACAALKATPSLDAARPVLLPGEPEQLARRERTAQGIPLAEATWQALCALADSLGINITG